MGAAISATFARQLTLSMSRLSSTIVIAKGHRPTPSNSPFCVSESTNSTPQASTTSARSTKQKDVATMAAKEAANILVSGAAEDRFTLGPAAGQNLAVKRTPP